MHFVSSTDMTPLSDRVALRITGTDAKSFLDGLLTCDLDRVGEGKARLGALLSPQGKILFDLLIVGAGEGYCLDCARSIAAEFAKRLGFYKLRAKVVIENLAQTHHVALIDEANPPDALVAFDDPRAATLGRRAILPGAATAGDISAYEAQRIAAGIPEGGKDFAFGNAFPHEALMDRLHGVDFDKGCYVGQEVVSRMQHRGTARTRIARAAYEGTAPAFGTELRAGERVIGQAGSSSGAAGLAMVRIDRAEEALAADEAISAGEARVTLDLTLRG